MRHWLLAIAVAVCGIGMAHAEEQQRSGPADKWSFYDYGEERGWSNTNKKGETVAIHGCEAAVNTGTYRFFFTGLFEKLSDDRKRQYRLSAGHQGRDLAPVFVYTSKGYFDYEYSFAVKAKAAERELGLQFCAQPVSEGTERCASFTGKNFRKVVANLCASGQDEPPEITEEMVLAPVEAFYLALEQGDGRAATANVIPEKRKNGPLSGPALTAFFDNLKKPLRLLGVKRTGEDKVLARYRYEPWSGKPCNGASVSTVLNVDGVLLISGIESVSGC